MFKVWPAPGRTEQSVWRGVMGGRVLYSLSVGGRGVWADCGWNYGADLIARFCSLEVDYGNKPEELTNRYLQNDTREGM